MPGLFSRILQLKHRAVYNVTEAWPAVGKEEACVALLRSLSLKETTAGDATSEVGPVLHSHPDAITQLVEAML